MSTMSALAMLGLILVVLGVYWLPSILALIWRHPDLVPIVLVNGLLGWTILGWVQAVWMLVRPGAVHPVRLSAAAAAAPGNAEPGWQLVSARELPEILSASEPGKSLPLDARAERPGTR